MCLKEFYVITFSNKEAFDRALALLENPKFKGKKIGGTFYKILKWNIKRIWKRKDLTFEELLSFWSSQFPWIYVQEVNFEGNRQLADAIGEVVGHDDIFGKIELELR